MQYRQNPVFGVPRTIGCCVYFLFYTSLLAPAWAQSEDAVRKQLQELCDRVKSENGLPAFFIAISTHKKNTIVVCNGIRKFGDDSPVTENDLIHIGSCTKAMTSCLIAKLVETKKLDWNQSIGDAFPNLKPNIHADYHAVTLEQLLQHRGRIPANARNWHLDRGKSISDKRKSIILDNLSTAPPKPTEDGFLYSNLGLMIAGAMAEKTTGKSWESLMKTEIFDPLNMKSAGFGPPNKRDKVDQPWGHTFGAAKALLPNQADNAAALGPAGTVHLSMEDWARFAEVYYRETSAPFLSPQSLEKIKTPASPNGYGMGWFVVDRPWAKGMALSHSGSNTSWFATIWVAPETNQAFMVATNSCRDDLATVLDEAVAGVIQIVRSSESDLKR